MSQEQRVPIRIAGPETGRKQVGETKISRNTAQFDPAAPRLRKPDWIRVRLPSGNAVETLKKRLRASELVTVCEEASCPNIHECFGKASTIGKTNVLNPGPLGVMIELKSKEDQTTEEKKQPDTKKEIKEEKRSGKDTIGKSAKKSGVKTSVAKNKSAGGKKK